MKLPEVLKESNRTTVLNLSGNVVKVKRRAGDRFWDRGKARMTQGAPTFSCHELGFKDVSRLDAEWRLLVACGNTLERYQHSQSLREWHL